MKTKLFNDKKWNWKSISWLTTDLTNFSKTLRKNLKSAFSYLIAWQETAYVQNRHNDEGGRSASHVTDISEKMDQRWQFSNCWYRRSFQLFTSNFFVGHYKKFSIGNNFIDWIKIWTDQESFVFNDSTTTPYFNLDNAAQQGDPLSTYLFTSFTLGRIKNNPNIKGHKIFNNYLYTAYVDDATFINQ